MKKISAVISFLFLLLLIVVVGLVMLVILKYFATEETVENVSNSKIVLEEIDDNKIKIENSNNSTEETIENTVVVDNTITEGKEVINKDGTQYFYYNQLNETQKKLYDGLKNNEDNMKSGTYVINFGNEFKDVLSEENGSETLGNDYQTAVDAYTQDNAGLFYIDISKIYLNIKTTKKLLSTTYEVYLAPKDENYFNDDFSNESEVNQAIAKVEYVKQVFKNNLAGSDYNKIKTLHDYLVNSIDYDEEYNAKGSYTIYGALIEKKCVCEGYARAFKYILDSIGIDCVLIQGTATNSAGKTESHAWNAVNLNNQWYQVDTTWDDPIIIGEGRVLDSTKYKYFLKGSQTFNKDHTAESKFSERGIEFTYPNMSIYDY